MRPNGHAHFHLPPAIRRVPALLGVVLLFAAIYAAQKEFRSLRLIDIENAVADIKPRALGCALLVSVLSYGLLTIYDRLGTFYAGCRVPYRRVAFASFCAYTLAHNLGFAALSGGAVRFRLYSHWGLTPVQIAKVVAFCGLTFTLGALTLGSVVLFSEPQSIPWFGQHLPASALYAAASVMLVIVLGYLVVSALLARYPMLSHGVDLPGLRMAMGQIALATADVGMTATIVWVLLPHVPGLTWLVFLGVYIGSFTAGLAASVPGGLGVFDSAMLFGLAPFLPADRVVAGILVFRFFYYVIPLFLAGILFAGNEVLVRGPVRVRITEPDLAVGAATGTVALSAVLLLGVGVLSRRTPDLTWADPDLVMVATRAGQFVPSLIGAALLVLGIALAQRVRLAWASTIVLLCVGAAFIVAEGERSWIAAILGLSALLLFPFRRHFYRRARLSFGSVDPASAVSLLALAVCMLALAGFRRQLHGMPNNAWWELISVGPHPLGAARHHRRHRRGRADRAVGAGASVPRRIRASDGRTPPPSGLRGADRRGCRLGRCW